MTFDRYLLRAFAHAFAICFLALFGLVVVIDLFENLDEFIKLNEGLGLQSLLTRIGWFYCYKSILFVSLAGPALSIISVVVVLILMQRSGELHPLLAAGVPMRRILTPLVLAAIMINGLLVVNQELIVPQFASYAMEDRGVSSQSGPEVESAYDHVTRIIIDGKQLRPVQRTIEQAEFTLPAPGMVTELTILQAEKAKYVRGSHGRPAGWYLIRTTPKYDELPLTEKGAKVIRPEPKIDGVFVATALTPDQLYKRSSNYTMLSSPELIQRIQNPAFGLVSVHRLVLHLHSRIVQPLFNVIAVIITIPLMVRRESMSLVIDAGLCAVLHAGLFGLTQVAQFLGGAHLIAPDLAAWLPVIAGGCAATLVGGMLKT